MRLKPPLQSKTMSYIIYNKAEKFVLDSFVSSGKPKSNKHFIQAVYWLKELKSDADEAMLVAMVAHDIERAFRTKEFSEKYKEESWLDKEFLTHHQQVGADIIANWLKENGVMEDFCDRVRHLVSSHEWGGDDDQNLIKDADSISFFECNLEHFINDLTKEKGVEKVREKIDWMFNRITSPRAKELCYDWYEYGIKKLEQV